MPNPQPTYGPVTDNTKPTDGGTTTVVTGDERYATDKCVQGTAGVYAPLGEDDSHVQGVYRRHSPSMEY